MQPKSLRITIHLAAGVLGGLLIFGAGCAATPTAPSTDAQPTPQPTAPPSQAKPAAAVTTAEPHSAAARPVVQATATVTVTVEPMPIPTPPAFGPYVYHTVAAGETLGYISMIYNTPLEQLVEMNNLSGPEAIINVEQQLRVPVQTDQVAPATPLMPDSEVVYGPSYVDFDLAGFIEEKGGYLATYEEYVDNELLTGPEIVEQVAIQFSVGPRLLLALLEHYGGWVTNPSPTEAQINAPLGPHNPRGGSLYLALGFTANRINAGYYGYKRDGFWIFYLPDGSEAISAEGLNAGTIGVQNILAIHSGWETWQQELAGEGLLTVYRELFGEPFAHEFSPIVPITLTQPPLTLPWKTGQGFYFTSGPHGGYADGSGWAAIDFGPPDVLAACFYSNEPNTAAAAGQVVYARQGEVFIDLDGDGHIQTGWVLYYLHVALDIDTPVQEGQMVEPGDVIGYASCEAGLSNASHLHFARRYNGEWMAAGGPVPMDLDGWVVQPNLVPYDGVMLKGSETREACECWEPDLNLLVNASPR